MQIKLIKSTFYNEVETKEKLCKFIKESSHLSIGRHCAEFETHFSAWQGRGHSVFFNSWSSANLALIQALLNLWRVSSGDKVAFSGITWATNAMPLIQLGLEPVPVDVELESLNVSSELFIEADKIHNFKAFFLTNLLGFSSDIERIREYCESRGIILLEDNCESLGSVSSGVKLGNFGLASTFSFFVGHHMSTLEGGMVCTDDTELSYELRKVRSHGWDRNLPSEEQQRLRSSCWVDDFYAKYTFYDLAYNLRPTEINGFVGVDQLQYLDEIIQKRQSNYFEFLKIFEYGDDFHKITPKTELVSNFAFPLILKDPSLLDSYVRKLTEAGIEIRPIVGWLMTKQPFFMKHVSAQYVLPNCELIHKQGFYFGNNPEMTEGEISYILSLFENA